MRTLTKTVLIFAAALLGISTVNAQKIDKKAARIAAYQKMIDTPDFKITLEKAFPKDANMVTLTGSPSISISGGTLTCEAPYYAGARVDGNSRVDFSTTNFIYQSQKGASGQKYNMMITPKPGSTDMKDVTQIVITIVTEEMVSVQISFNGKEALGYEGYIEKYKP
ncbi:MAG: hypothetical protein JWQ79_2295 [Mucilaginibacter sp.]|nr:hypothetical protein [Mucilaginibacter sp.]